VSPVRELPALAEDFLATLPGRHAARVIRMLHRWLDEQGVGLGMLEPGHVDAFLACPSGGLVQAKMRNDYRYKVRRYVDWLHAHGAIGFNADWLRVRHKVLAAPAEDFLASLRPTLRPATCTQYRGSLRSLHDWMDERGLVLEGLSRPELQA
jgi:hypothetical protein